MCARACVRVHMCARACVCVCMCTCVRVHTCAYACTHVHALLGADGAAGALREVERGGGGAGAAGPCSKGRRPGSLGEASGEMAPAGRNAQGIGQVSGGFCSKISNECQKLDNTIVLKGRNTSPPGGYEILFFGSLSGPGTQTRAHGGEGRGVGPPAAGF